MTDEVLALMQQAAEVAIMPRFRNLQTSDIEEKSPGEVVTGADREAELIISQVLQKLRPDAVFVGEEAAAANPGLLKAVSQQETVSLVDPLDGTANFVAGHEDFAVMVALVEQGQTTAAWIWHPVAAQSWVARRGEGVEHNGKPIEPRLAATANRPLRGSIHSRFFDAAHKEHVAQAGPEFAEVIPGRNCSGVEYPEVARGNHDFSVFRRILPWDHAPGALILQESGGVAHRWSDGDVLNEMVDYYRARAAEYDEWFYRKGRYDRGAATNSRWFAESDELFSFFDSLPLTGHALELAPGTGIWTERLIRLADHITAVDASAEMLAINRTKLGANQEHVTYVVANLFEWQPEPVYDCLLFCFWLSHLPERRLDSFLRQVASALRPGGKLFFVDSKREEAGSSPDQPLPPTGDEIATRQLNDGRQFQIVKNFYDPADLSDRFRAARLSIDVRETETYFTYGFGQRA